MIRGFDTPSQCNPYVRVCLLQWKKTEEDILVNMLQEDMQSLGEEHEVGRKVNKLRIEKMQNKSVQEQVRLRVMLHALVYSNEQT